MNARRVVLLALAAAAAVWAATSPSLNGRTITGAVLFAVLALMALEPPRGRH